jgi:hypothetical protein
MILHARSAGTEKPRRLAKAAAGEGRQDVCDQTPQGKHFRHHQQRTAARIGMAMSFSLTILISRSASSRGTAVRRERGLRQIMRNEEGVSGIQRKHVTDK